MKKNLEAKSHVNFKNTFNPHYKKVLEKINEEGFCPFCEKNFTKHHPKKIHFKTKYWIVTDNGWPYKGTKKHLLMVYRPSHICHLEDLSNEAVLDKFEIEKKLCKKYKIKGGSILMRFGSSHETGASVEHLHFHIITPNKKSKDYDPKNGVTVRVG